MYSALVRACKNIIRDVKVLINGRKAGEVMSEKKKNDIKKTVDVLKQLDEKSLLIIDSGAKMLMARQSMDREEKQDG